MVLRMKSGTRQVATLVRWIRAMLPAALLVVAPLDGPVVDVPEDAITVDADAVRSGPLSLADAVMRAARSLAGRSQRA